jgi:hypothetical protein
MTVAKKETTITWDKDCTGCSCRFTDSMSTFVGKFPRPMQSFKVPAGVCPECNKAEKARWEKLIAARDLHWTRESVKEYFTQNPPVTGQELIILDTSWRTNTYALVTVENPEHTRQKRIVIKHHSNGYNGQSFYRSGQNCFAPTGQVQLLPYHPVIGELIKKGNGQEVSLTLEEVALLLG